MTVQIGMGTGATNITLATANGWKEFSTAHHGAPATSKRQVLPSDYDEQLNKHLTEISKQLVIDAASDERLSARQMIEAAAWRIKFWDVGFGRFGGRSAGYFCVKVGRFGGRVVGGSLI